MNTQDIWNEVCEMLPEGWRVEIHLEQGSGDVELMDPHGDSRDVWLDDATFEDRIREAVKIAISRDGDY